MDKQRFKLSSFRFVTDCNRQVKPVCYSPFKSAHWKMKSDQIIEKIRNKLKESDPENRTVVSVFQFNFIDDGGQLIKSVVFDLKDLNIYEGSTTAPDAEITVSDEDFYLVGKKETTFDALLANNKAQVQGDADAINKMMEKFRLNSNT